MGVKVGDLNVNCLLYADDAVLIASSECELQVLVSTLKEVYENNLSLNTKKTKVLVFERDEERTECKISVNGKILEQVDEVVYWESIFSRDGRYEIDAEKRITASNRVNGVMMRRGSCSTAAHLPVYNIVLVPSLL